MSAPRPAPVGALYIPYVDELKRKRELLRALVEAAGAYFAFDLDEHIAAAEQAPVMTGGFAIPFGASYTPKIFTTDDLIEAQRRKELVLVAIEELDKSATDPDRIPALDAQLAFMRPILDGQRRDAELYETHVQEQLERQQRDADADPPIVTTPEGQPFVFPGKRDGDE